MTMTMNSKRIFIVEDEAILLCDLEDIVIHLGFDHVGSATSLDQAMDFLASGTQIDLTLLDLNLNGESSEPIADHLLAANVGVLFVSGYGRHGLADRFADCHVLQKPYDEQKLAAALEHLVSARA
jgi:CheY-like chemotaxis protein